MFSKAVCFSKLIAFCAFLGVKVFEVRKFPWLTSGFALLPSNPKGLVEKTELQAPLAASVWTTGGWNCFQAGNMESRAQTNCPNKVIWHEFGFRVPLQCAGVHQERETGPLWTLFNHSTGPIRMISEHLCPKEQGAEGCFSEVHTVSEPMGLDVTNTPQREIWDCLSK